MKLTKPARACALRTIGSLRAGFTPAHCDAAKPILTRIGDIVDRNWKDMSTHFPNIALDEYVIMPNHFLRIPEEFDISPMGF